MIFGHGQDCGYHDRVRRCAQTQLKIFGNSAVMTNHTLDEESLGLISDLIDKTLTRIADSDVRHNVPAQGKFDDMLFNRTKIIMKEIVMQEQAAQTGRA